MAALGIQRQCKKSLSELVTRFDLPEGWLGVGVGIHTGPVEIGEFSKGRADFTAIGGVVNMAARLESRAAAGEIVLSAEAAARVPAVANEASARTLELKGIAAPVTAWVL